MVPIRSSFSPRPYDARIIGTTQYHKQIPGKGNIIDQLSATARTRPGRGRPTQAQQVQRREDLLEVALETFLERGFDQTTTEEVAARVGMSKRTVYALHRDKSALFDAAVRRAIERYTIPRAAIDAVSTGDLEGTLKAIARLRIANVATPNGIRLQRILASQAYRFPDLFGLAFAQATVPVIDYLEELFGRRDIACDLGMDDPRRAATAYLSLVVGGMTRMIVSGRPMTDAEIEDHISYTVGVFLNGIRRR